MRFATKLSVAVLISISAMAHAQGIRTIAVRAGSEQVPNVTNASDRIKVDFNNTPLRNAVKTIIERSGAGVLYSFDQLPATHKVTFSANSITAEAALSTVLRGTSIRLERLSDGRLKLVQGPQANRAPGAITGRVTDVKTGRGVAGVTISVAADARGVTTGEDGTYRLTGVTAGVHTVTVRMVGYAKQTKAINVGDGATVTADFQIESSASVLDQVIVTGTIVATELKQVPSAMTVVTAKQIEQRGITQIQQLFRGDIPGLFALNIDGRNDLDTVVMSSRGTTKIESSVNSTDMAAQPIKTYVDGVELANAAYLSQIDPRSIERIEIITGPQASTIYGSNALGGVMQIFTKRGSTNRPSFTLDLNSGWVQNNFSSAMTPIHSHSGRVSGKEGRFSYQTGVSWDYTGSWSPAKLTQRLSGDGAIRTEFGLVTADASTRRGHTQNSRRGLYAQGWSEWSSRGGARYVNSLQSEMLSALDGQSYSMALGYTPTSWWSHQFTAGADEARMFSQTGDIMWAGVYDSVRSYSESRTLRVSQRYTTALQVPVTSLARLTLTAGGERSRATGMSMYGTGMVLTGSLTSPSVSRNKPMPNSGAFLQGQLGIYDALFLTYGVRAEWNPSYGKNARVLPGRYGAAYTRDFGSVSAKLRASYGRSTRPPSDNQRLAVKNTNTTNAALYGDFNTQLENPELGPEFQQGGEGGVELYIGNRGSLVITRYNQTVDALINSVSSVDSVPTLQPNSVVQCATTYPARWTDGYCYATQTQNLNIGSIRNQGWEVQGSMNIGPLTTRGSYSWVKNRFGGITPKYRAKFGSNPSYQRGYSYNYVPEHTWATSIGYSQSGSHLAVNFTGKAQTFICQSCADMYYVLGGKSYIRLPIMTERWDVGSAVRGTSPGYIEASLNGSHRFSSLIESTLQVDNLTNHYRSDRDWYLPTMGRQTRVGLRFRWQ